jgi:hypothetical protein
MSKYYKPPVQYAVYEKVPAHGGEVDGVILGNYRTKEEAQEDREKYGYNTDNYYIDVIIFKPKQRR